MQALNGFSHFGQCPWYWPAYQDGSLRQIRRDDLGDWRQTVRDHGGDLSRGNHADLDRIDPDVVVDGVNLIRDKPGLDHLKGAYAAGVLGGERSDDRRAVGAER